MYAFDLSVSLLCCVYAQLCCNLRAMPYACLPDVGSAVCHPPNPLVAQTLLLPVVEDRFVTCAYLTALYAVHSTISGSVTGPVMPILLLTMESAAYSAVR